MAEELVQDTFVRLCKAAQRFDPALGSARVFIFTIARRAAIDLLRRRSSRPLTTAGAAGQGEDGAESPMSEDQFDRLLLRLDVRDALGALTDHHREILELAYDDDSRSGRSPNAWSYHLGR